MRVLLIAVPTIRIRYNISGVYPLPPLGLACIASVLKRDGFSVDILDMDVLGMSLSAMESYLKDRDYPVIGLSCRSIFTLKNTVKLAKAIKGVKPRSRIIGGGPGFAFSPEIIFRHIPDCDIIIHGEGEETMLKLCNSFKEGKGIRAGIDSISYRDGENIITIPKTLYTDIDALPFPARDLLPNHRYRMHPPFGIYPAVTLMETSRGCSYDCTFCSLRRPVKEKSVSRIIEEIKEVAQRYKVREVHFVDPNFTYKAERINEMCERLIQEKIKISWTCKTRVDLVPEDLLNIMYRAGCYMISYGVESGSQKILDILNKGITLQETKRIFRLTRKAGIRTLAYIMIGAPGENEETVMQTIKFAKMLKPDFVLYGELLPAPNSTLVKEKIYDNCLEEKDLFDFYVSDKDIFRRKNINDIPRDDLKRWITMAYKSFYLRPAYLIQRLTRLKNIKDFVNLAKGAYFLILDKFKRKGKVF